MLIFTALVIILSCIIYWRFGACFGYWKKRGIPNPEPSFFFGNIRSAFTLSKSLGQLYTEFYNDYKGLRYFGAYKLRTPTIVVRDPEILKNIFIKDFSNFHDNDIDVTSKDDIFSKSPFVLKGAEWKTVRTQLTPSFTSGKIKSIFPLLNTIGNNLVNYLANEPSASGKDGMDTKELASKFTTDAVATCAFGLEANSFTDPNAEFRTMGRKLMTPSFLLGLKHLLIFIMPGVAKLFKLRFVPPDASNWFRSVVNQTVEYRMKNNISRNDFIDLMMQLKATLGENNFTNEDIASHCTMFFLEGFETSSGTLAYNLYEIAANPEVQIKLREEIERVLELHGGTITYDSIQDMHYLEKVFLENMRKNPATLVLFKKCTQQYTLPPHREDNTGTEHTIEVGTPIVVPVIGIQHDPKYYPNPEKFDPERFDEENKKNRPKCALLSFGEGPRICLGQRFAIAQVKMALISIVSNYDIRVNPKTNSPLQTDPKFFMLSAKGGIWLNYYKRSDKKKV